MFVLLLTSAIISFPVSSIFRGSIPKDVRLKPAIGSQVPFSDLYSELYSAHWTFGSLQDSSLVRISPFLMPKWDNFELDFFVTDDANLNYY